MLSNKRIIPSRPGVVATVVPGGVVLGGVVVSGCVVTGGAVMAGAGVGAAVVVAGGAVVSGDVEGAAVLGFIDAAEDNTSHENVCRLALHRRAASADLRTESQQHMESKLS